MDFNIWCCCFFLFLGCFLGTGHGTNEEKKGFELQKPVQFKVGVNHIAILAATLGLPVRGSKLYPYSQFQTLSQMTIFDVLYPF